MVGPVSPSNDPNLYLNTQISINAQQEFAQQLASLEEAVTNVQNSDGDLNQISTHEASIQEALQNLQSQTSSLPIQLQAPVQSALNAAAATLSVYVNDAKVGTAPDASASNQAIAACYQVACPGINH